MEIPGLQNLRKHHVSIIGGVGRRVGNRAIGLLESGKTGVFDAIDLAWCKREKDFLGDIQSISEPHRVVRPREHEGTLTGLAHRGLVGACAEAADMVDQILHEKAFWKTMQCAAGIGVFHTEFLKFSQECRSVVSSCRLRTGLANITGDGIHPDLTFQINDSRAEGNG